jgi:hypothetical protein
MAPSGAVAAVLVLVGARAQGEDLTILGLGIERTITCDTRDVVVNGAGHRLTLKGRCARVAVHGTGHVVHVERLGRGLVDGMDNRLEWEQAIEGERPEIRIGGVNNRAAQAGGATAARSAATADESGVTVQGSEGRIVLGDGGVTVERGKRRGGNVTITSGGVTVGTAGKGSLTIAASDVTETHDCAGGSVTVDGSDDVLTLRHCPELTVTGGGNRIVLVGPVRRIRLLGGENRVQWSEGEGGRPPKVETPGAANEVVRR